MKDEPRLKGFKQIGNAAIVKLMKIQLLRKFLIKTKFNLQWTFFLYIINKIKKVSKILLYYETRNMLCMRKFLIYNFVRNIYVYNK